MAADSLTDLERSRGQRSVLSRRRRDVVVLLGAAFALVFLLVPGTPPLEWAYALVWLLLWELVVVFIAFLGPQWNNWERICALVAALGLPIVVLRIADWVTDIVRPSPPGTYTPSSVYVHTVVGVAVTLAALAVLTRPVRVPEGGGQGRFRVKVALAVTLFAAWTSISAVTGWPW